MLHHNVHIALKENWFDSHALCGHMNIPPLLNTSCSCRYSHSASDFNATFCSLDKATK